MPVHLIVSTAATQWERGVALDQDDGLAWADRPLTGTVLGAVQSLDLPRPAEGTYLTEINLAAPAWMREWAARLEHGAMILIDYGYPRAEYYLPNRSNGTLQCYYRHRAHGDPLLWPGLNDITTFVDFTSIAEAAHDAGLQVLGYTNQANFLFNCGLLERLATRGEEGSADYIRAARAAQRLTAPQEMGELFKVLALGTGLTQPLRGFSRGDRLHTL
jgi:SAM-dependent MidA family methyltransferase